MPHERRLSLACSRACALGSLTATGRERPTAFTWSSRSEKSWIHVLELGPGGRARVAFASQISYRVVAATRETHFHNRAEKLVAMVAGFALYRQTLSATCRDWLQQFDLPIFWTGFPVSRLVIISSFSKNIANINRGDKELKKNWKRKE